jgi:hypothetical protein
MADGCGHPAHLAVSTFGQLQLQPGGRDRGTKADRWKARPQIRRFIDSPDFGGAGHAVAQRDTVHQTAQHLIVGETFNLRPVSFDEAMLRVSDLRLPGSVVGEEQQPFTVGVEPASSVNIGDIDKIRQRRTSAIASELAQDTVGFMEAQ